MAESRNVATGASRIFERLRQDLLDGRFAAGEKLAISALKDHYDISLSPLREALNRLAAYGLLEQENQRGFRVPRLSKEELDDIMMMRKALEGMALERAIMQGDAEWESQLLAAAHRLKRADETGLTGIEWESLHAEFHHTLVRPCGSVWLLRFIAQLHDQFDRYRRMAPAIPEIRQTLDRQHGELTTLALERSAVKARELLDDHIHLSYRVALGSCGEDARQ